MKKDLLNLVQSLMAYYHRGMVGLVEVQDIESPVASFSLNEARNEQTKLSESSSPQKKLNLMARPLIACVDDSNQVCATIEQIVTGFGFGFLGIRDSINVLPLLVELKPEMIILDLVMPIVGGYELCTQIRRIPEFKDTPILILTSNDTLFDRLRSKFVGATAFISKTAGNEKIGEQIQRYLLPFDNEPEEISSIDSSDTSK